MDRHAWRTDGWVEVRPVPCALALRYEAGVRDGATDKVEYQGRVDERGASAGEISAMPAVGVLLWRGRQGGPNRFHVDIADQGE